LGCDIASVNIRSFCYLITADWVLQLYHLTHYITFFAAHVDVKH